MLLTPLIVRTSGMEFPDGVFAGSWKLTSPKPTKPGASRVKEGCTEIPLKVMLTADVGCDHEGLPEAAFPVPGLLVIGPMPVKYIVMLQPGPARKMPGLPSPSLVKIPGAAARTWIVVE